MVLRVWIPACAGMTQSVVLLQYRQLYQPYSKIGQFEYLQTS
jgi:hypothetical protein